MLGMMLMAKLNTTFMERLKDLGADEKPRDVLSVCG